MLCYVMAQARRLTAEGDLQPVVEFFQEQGLSKEEVVKVAFPVHAQCSLHCLLFHAHCCPHNKSSSHLVLLQVIVEYPAALCYSTSRLGSLLDYLRSLGIQSPVKVVLQRPSLLGVDVERGLAQIVQYLQANDYSVEQIEQLLATTL